MFRIILAWTLIVLHLQVTYSQPPTSFEEAITRANDIAEKTVVRSDFPGLAIGVSYDGIPVWKKGFCYADIEKHTPVHPDSSLFRIGSV